MTYEVYGTIKSCRNNAILSGDQVGGIAYHVKPDGTVDGCENTAAIESEGYAVGGIAYENKGTVIACVNYGSITAVGYAGGIVYTNAGTVKGCGNYASISTSGKWSAAAGGIAAEISNYSTGEPGAVEGCENHAAITSANDVAGGIVGQLTAYQPDTTITSCRSSGTVSGKDAGGIVGSGCSFYSGSLVVEQCENTGTIRARGNGQPIAGGILGRFSLYSYNGSTPLTLADVHNDGVIKNAAEDAAMLGGIVGAMWMETAPWPLVNAFSSGTVIRGSERDDAGTLVGHCVFGNSVASGLSFYRKSGSLDAVGGRGGSIDTSAPGTIGLTAAEMANTSTFETFDFTNVWEMADRPRLRMEGLSSARQSGAGYYTELSDRLFRIVVPGDNSYPGPSGFTVRSGNTTRHSGGGADVNFPLEADSKDPIVFSKDGYHTYEMPRRLAQRYNVVTMVPNSVKTPFVQSILLKRVYGNGGYSYDNLRSGIISVYTMNVADAANYEGESVYVDVNWNGHKEGSIWLEQNGVRLPLADDVFSAVEMGKQFKPGSPVYVCVGEENGVIHRTYTTVQIVENPAQLKVNFTASDLVDPGENPTTRAEIWICLPARSSALTSNRWRNC